jgi:phosphatidylglycerophosphatase A
MMTRGLGPRESCALAVATLFGAGRSPIAPGTAGTLAAVPLAVLAAWLLPAWGFALVAAALSLLGIWAGGVAAPILGSKDPRPVVIDEAAGFFVTLLWIPLGIFGAVQALTLTVAFVLFRIMDVVKPPPARRAERLPGGWGIVADDLIAGLYANLALRVLRALFHRLAA